MKFHNEVSVLYNILAANRGSSLLPTPAFVLTYGICA